ncbi:hypothetical protein QLH52_22410 [Methylomonas sp. OY6]|uniref:Uncharacterized protein n=1 Tax=Methylomonas defluvii TaxID=3045149 RepID=A0ABU4UMM7_9GAMM|nr:hypothetical protein [Methylomonas sp. OY6]MDX8130060.1 hypothetical protein [Methylomonas sp. OY6]
MENSKAEVRVFTLNVGLKFKSAIQIIKVVGWISEAPSTYLRSYGGWRFAYPPYGPAVPVRLSDGRSEEHVGLQHF